MTVFVVGLNAPSLPLLPLFTCACAARHKSSSKIVGPVRKMIRASFIEKSLFGLQTSAFGTVGIETESLGVSKTRFLRFGLLHSGKA